MFTFEGLVWELAIEDGFSSLAGSEVPALDECSFVDSMDPVVPVADFLALFVGEGHGAETLEVLTGLGSEVVKELKDDSVRFVLADSDVHEDK